MSDEKEQAKCCDEVDRMCCGGQCFPPGTAFFAPCEDETCGCPDEVCCSVDKPVCCGDECITLEESASRGCPADSDCCPPPPTTEVCCKKGERCCDGKCIQVPASLADAEEFLDEVCGQPKPEDCCKNTAPPPPPPPPPQEEVCCHGQCCPGLGCCGGNCVPEEELVSDDGKPIFCTALACCFDPKLD